MEFGLTSPRSLRDCRVRTPAVRTEGKEGEGLSRTYRRRPDGGDGIRVRAIRKDPPDLRRLARALIELAQLQEEADAEKQHKKEKSRNRQARPDSGTAAKDQAGDAA